MSAPSFYLTQSHKQAAPEVIKAEDMYCRHPFILMCALLVMTWTVVANNYWREVTHASDTGLADAVPIASTP